MADAALELRSILDSAERAASDGDFASAEHCLRQAALLQEAQLGPRHPDLANTLNNLGIVCERVGKAADAEASYRRAYAVARSTLSADDPLVLTSGQNLRDFCAATGAPFEPVKASPPPVEPPAPVKPSAPSAPVKPPALIDTPKPIDAPPRSMASERQAVPAIVGRHGRTWLTWVVIGGGLLLAIALASLWPRSDDSPAPAAASVPRVETAAPREPAPIEQPAPQVEPPPPVVAATPPAPAVPVNAAPRPATSSTVSVADAKLCRSLSTSNWQCTPPASPAGPGVYFFYTRVKSGRDTTVEHRWYLNGNLRRTVELRVVANPGAGYRTYSRNTVIAERRGTWTMELRDADGALLHEERVVIQ